MRFDYELFGDVITFDTTFATNKEYRHFGVFAGFNQYRGIIIFGAALLYDETIDSFIWLFETFLEAYNHKKPKTVFTDQDAAMTNAIGQVIPETSHGLCTWHLMQNGIKHLGNLMKDGSYFLSNFKKIMFEYENEEKFEVAWNELLSSFSVEDNSWLASIYKIKEKWGKCYMKTAVTLGMRSTQLSESLNGDLKDYLKSNFDLGFFFKHFERVIDDKRYKELQAEFDSREKMSRLRVKSLPLLQQAGGTYTPLIFENFQDEWEKSLSTFAKHRHEDNAVVIASFIEEGEYMISCNKINEIVTCRCMKFEMFGILCSHALKVLDLLDIKSIPEKYILRRWTRCARNEIMEKTDRDIEGSIKSDMADRYKELCPMLVKLASKASKTQEGYLLLKEEIKKMNKHLDENQSSQCHEHNINNAYMSVSLSEGIDHTTMDHLLVNSKGLKKKEGRKDGKRLKSWVEKQPKKREKRTNFLNLEEVGKQVLRLPTQLSTSTSFSGVLDDSGLFVDKEGFNFLKL